MKTLIYISFLLACFSIKAQSSWDIEREKEHGVLRLSIDELEGDYFYYFVYKNKSTQNFDTLRNQEAHLDLGNPESDYFYSIGKLLKAMPPGVYGKKSINKHIYEDWSYVSFPILGLSEAQVWVTNSNNEESMRIYFEFDSSDTADYIFQLNFKPGNYLIDAPLLKHFSLSNRFTELYSTIPLEQMLEQIQHSPYKYLGEPLVIPSKTRNPNLSIVKIEDPEALRCFPFYEGLRYSSPLASTLKAIEHPFYKKIKYQSPIDQMMVPNYMKADSSNDEQKAYCIEHTYVKPLYLYSDNIEADGIVSISKNSPTVNRKLKGATDDTTFLSLESYLEALLFSKNNPCNQPFYSVSQVAFPFKADSLVSIEVTETFFKLPPADSMKLMEYNKELKKAIEKAERPPKKNFLKSFFSFFNPNNKIEKDNQPYMPKLESLKLPMPDYEVNIPNICDSLIYSQPSKNYLNNGYYSWEAVDPCYNWNDSNYYSINYFSMVLNPYTLQPYDPEELFGPNFREVVYTEIIKEYERIHSSHEYLNFNFNVNHYRPEFKRRFMWGIDQEYVVIYFGNEGEFSAYRKLLIPYEKFQ
jgi:hypothetical protein